METNLENKNDKTGERIIYLDVMRIAAVFAVVVLHTSAQNWPNVTVPFSTWLMFDLWDGAVQWAVPVYIMISGALFLSRDRDISIKKLYMHNILHIVMAFLCWSFLYSVYQVHIEGGGFARILALTLEGHYHMWFLFMITALYVITPLLRRLSEEDLKYLLTVSLILFFLIPTLIGIKDAVLPFLKNDMLKKALDQIFVPYSKFMDFFNPGYVAYFVLGHFLSEREISKSRRSLIYIAMAVSYVFTVSFSAIITYFGGRRYGIYDMFTMNILFEAVGIFVLIKNRFSPARKLSEKTANRIVKLSGCSFGIYLVHAMILELMNNELALNTLSFAPFFSVPVIAIAVFLISLAVTAVIKKIPILGKHIV